MSTIDNIKEAVKLTKELNTVIRNYNEMVQTACPTAAAVCETNLLISHISDEDFEALGFKFADSTDMFDHYATYIDGLKVTYLKERGTNV